MASSVIAVEWLNQNSLRNYPFREDCGMRPDDSAGAVIEDGWHVPSYLVVDFVAGVSGSDYNPTVYLKRMSVIDGSLSMVFADSAGEDAFTVSAEKEDTEKELSGVGSFKDASGVIRFGDLSRFFSDTPEGLYRFSQEETLLEPCCIRPSAIGVRSISAMDASGYVTEGLQGEVKLVAGDNINLTYLKESNAIVISADPDSGYTDGCECDDEESSVVRSINGIKTENVVIKGDDCVSVTTEDGVITISDTCSKPCCGCAETSFINQTVNDLQSSVSTLANNASLLSERIDNFVSSFLLARKSLG